MNKNNYIIKILCLITVLFLVIFTTNINLIPTIIGLSIYIILLSSLSHIRLTKEDKNILLPTIKCILVLNIIITIISYFISLFTKYYLNINNIEIPLIFLSLSISYYYIFKLIDIFIKTKISSINKYYIIITILATILTIIINIFNINSNIANILICSIPLISGIITLIILIINNKKDISKLLKTNKNIKSIIKWVFLKNTSISLINIINNTYLYISVIYIYYLLTNIYNYNINTINILITNTYLYGYILITISINIILYILNKKYNINNSKELINNISSIYYKIFLILLPIIIIIIMLSTPIWTFIFNDNTNSYILIGLAIYIFFYTLYLITIKLLNKLNKNNITIQILLIGILFKIIFTPAVIESFYRMSYPLILGDLISTTISYIIVILIGNYIITKKYKITIYPSIEKILNIIYNNIVLMLELILLTAFVKMNKVSRVNALLVIIIYSTVALILYIIRLYINKNKKQRKD